MLTVKPLRATLIACAALFLVGCSPGRYLTLSPEEANLPPCSETSPISVESLDSVERATCNPEGADLVFPDGTILNMPGSGAGAYTRNIDDALVATTYSYSNVGIYGIVATQERAGCQDLKIWGPLEARDKLKEAYGDEWACHST
jgi:hypothetical protein